MDILKQKYKFVNPPLPYAYDALEPYIDERTMHLHHDKHLQTYVDNLNKAIETNDKLKNKTLQELLYFAAELPEPTRTAVVNNGGGVFNHVFMFDALAPASSTQPGALTLKHINKHFGSLDKFKEQMKSAALSVFGSGYAWLVFDKDGNLKIITSKNQDTPLPLNLYPIMNLDVWEHAYYLKHQNLRADYIDAYFNVINWDEIEKRFAEFEKKYKK